MFDTDDYLKFIYGVTFLPPPGPNCESGSWGFIAGLDSEFAYKARNTNMPKEYFNHFQRQGRTIIERFGLGKMSKSSYPYIFIDNSWLLHIVTVQMGACQLGLDPMENSQFFDGWQKLKIGEQLPPPLEYLPHNVSSMVQSYSLLYLFVNWADGAKATLFGE